MQSTLSELLLIAAEKGDIVPVQTSLAQGAEVNAKDDDGQTALIKAAWEGYSDIIQTLLDNGAEVDAKDSDGQTALMWAARGGHTDIVETLLDYGADVNAESHDYRSLYLYMTALMGAIHEGHTDIIRILLHEGAHVNAATRYGETALGLAVREGRTEIAELLRKHSDKEELPLVEIDNPTLIYKWVLKKVTYKETQPAFIPDEYEGFTLNPNGSVTWILKKITDEKIPEDFIPKNYTGFTLHPNGSITWSDGCNYFSSTCKVKHDTFIVGPEGSSGGFQTEIGPPEDFQDEDVNYYATTNYRLVGNTLTLYTPYQIYSLEKFPFSPMSMNRWSLHSILNRKTGKVQNLARFRTDADHLSLGIHHDQTFEFCDLDRQKYTGTVTVAEGRQVRMGYDGGSRTRLQGKTKTYTCLSDSIKDYKKTKKQHATWYADALHWESVESFKTENGFLYFYSHDEIYKFEPR